MEDINPTQQPHGYAVHPTDVQVKKWPAAQLETRANIYKVLG